ncbi:MAG: hypothetical protein ACRC33_30665, partial [Gemmataceae bacterium]
MYPEARTCVICEATLPPFRAGVLCDDLRCRWKYDATPRQLLCAACGRFLGPHELAERWCGRTPCQLARVTWEAGQVQKAREALEERGRRLRDRVAGAAGVADPGAYPLLLVPSITRPLVTVPEYRRADMAAHLAAVFAEAALPEEDPADEPPPAPPPTDRADAVL